METYRNAQGPGPSSAWSLTERRSRWSSAASAVVVAGGVEVVLRVVTAAVFVNRALVLGDFQGARSTGRLRTADHLVTYATWASIIAGLAWAAFAIRLIQRTPPLIGVHDTDPRARAAAVRTIIRGDQAWRLYRWWYRSYLAFFALSLLSLVTRPARATSVDDLASANWRGASIGFVAAIFTAVTAVLASRSKAAIEASPLFTTPI
jgi:hypothetical protein